MATNLELDDRLIEKAKKLGGHASKREAVESALREYVAAFERRGILELFGAMEMEPHGAHERGRRARR